MSHDLDFPAPVRMDFSKPLTLLDPDARLIRCPDLDTWAVVFRDGSTMSGLCEGRNVRYPADRREEVLLFTVGQFNSTVGPIAYRKRVKLRSDGLVRWCHIMVMADGVVFVHDDGAVVRMRAFAEGTEWYYPISYDGMGGAAEAERREP